SHLAALVRHRADLRPLTFAVTVEDLASPFIEALLDLHGDGYSVVIDSRSVDAIPARVASRCSVILPEPLKLTIDEARTVAPGSLAGTAVEALWNEAGGSFTPLMSSVHQAVRLPRLTVPSPSGPLVETRNATLAEPRTAVL